MNRDDDLEWKCEYIKNDDKTWTWSVVKDRHVYESSVAPDLQQAREAANSALTIHKKRFERDNNRGKRKASKPAAQRRPSSGGTEGSGKTE